MKSFAAILLGLTVMNPQDSPRKVDPQVKPAQGTIQSLAWLAGDWSSGEGATTYDESWMPPKAGAMIGSFRLISGNQTRITEHLSLAEDSGGVTMIFRHFRPGMIPVEAADRPITMPVVEFGPTHVVFANKYVGEMPRRVEYRATGDRLNVVVETERQGNPERLELVFTRRATSPSR